MIQRKRNDGRDNWTRGARVATRMRILRAALNGPPSPISKRLHFLKYFLFDDQPICGQEIQRTSSCESDQCNPQGCSRRSGFGEFNDRLDVDGNQRAAIMPRPASPENESEDHNRFDTSARCRELLHPIARFPPALLADIIRVSLKVPKRLCANTGQAGPPTPPCKRGSGRDGWGAKAGVSPDHVPMS
jgi:hypothetical protein